MSTVPTPSQLPQDLKENSGRFDEVMASDAHYYVDRFGVKRWTIAGFQFTAEEAISNYGYITMDSFEDGATLTLPNQVLRYEATGEYYRWDGDFPKAVAAGSTPESTGGVGLGAWVGVGDASLRTNLASASGATLIGYKNSATGSVSRTQDDKNEDTISIKDFGAAGDGVTDDSQAIKDAIAAANGKKVIFPPGKYRLLNYIKLPTNGCYLSGEVGSEIYLDPSMTLGESFGGLQRALYAMFSSNITFDNLTFISKKTDLTNSITVAFQGGNGLTVRNCKFKDFGDSTYYAQGIVCFGVNDVIIENSIFDNCSGDGAALSFGCLRYTIKNNTFSNNGDWGCALVEGSNYGNVTGNIFLNNKSTATGVDRCSFVNFIGNTMFANEHGVRVAEFSVSDNKSEHITIVGNNINQSIYGISIEGMKPGAGNFTISANTILNSSDHGIRVIDSEHGTITGNTIFSAANAGILLNNLTAGKSTGYLSIAGNNIMSCAYGIREVLTAGTLSYNSIGINNINSAGIAAISVTGNSTYIDSNDHGYIYLSTAIGMPSDIVSFTAASGGTPLPVNAQGFIPVKIGTEVKKIPFYN